MAISCSQVSPGSHQKHVETLHSPKQYTLTITVNMNFMGATFKLRWQILRLPPLSFPLFPMETRALLPFSGSRRNLVFPLSVPVWCAVFSPANCKSNKTVKLSFLFYYLFYEATGLTLHHPRKYVETETGSAFSGAMAVRRADI